MELYWLSSRRMIVGVYVNDGLIVESAPILKKFMGQPLESLTEWMKKQGGFRMAGPFFKGGHGDGRSQIPDEGL